MAKRETVTYQEKYRKPGIPLLGDKLPDLKHLNPGFKCVEANVQTVGVIKRGDKEIEFQDIRVYLKGEE